VIFMFSDNSIRIGDTSPFGLYGIPTASGMEE
jgi:hypothetical protein